MTQKMITQSTRLYKVAFELQNTGEVFNIVVEAPDAFTATDSVMTSLGKGYDHVKTYGVKQGDLS